jgi:hypothetical protein
MINRLIKYFQYKKFKKNAKYIDNCGLDPYVLFTLICSNNRFCLQLKKDLLEYIEIKYSIKYNTKNIFENIKNNVSSDTPVSPAVSSVPAEKLVPQSEVNRIVGRIRDESYNKGMNDARSKPVQQEAPGNYEPQQTYQQPVQQQYAGGVPQQNQEQIRAMIAEENQKLEQFRTYQGQVNSLVTKIEAEKDKYEDFDDSVKHLNLPQIPVIWQTAEKLDNPAAVLYHLSKNPTKLSQLLAIGYSPELVKKGMQEISDSIKQNDASKEQRNPSAPLNRITPSNISMGNGDSENLSVSDYRKIFRNI